jgi:hypothetical protein
MKTICLRVSKEFDHRLRLLAAEQDLSRSALIRQTLEEKLRLWTVAQGNGKIMRHLAPAPGSSDFPLDRSVPSPIEDSASPTVEQLATDFEGASIHPPALTAYVP